MKSKWQIIHYYKLIKGTVNIVHNQGDGTKVKRLLNTTKFYSNKLLVNTTDVGLYVLKSCLKQKEDLVSLDQGFILLA